MVAFSPYLGSKEMERKLIGAVNVNTRMDVHDRKSGLVNWLTVSPLFPSSSRVCSLRRLAPSPSRPASSDSFHRLLRNHRFAFSISVALSRYLLRPPAPLISPLCRLPTLLIRFFSLSLSLVLQTRRRSLSSGSPPTELSARTRRSILHLADSLDF